MKQYHDALKYILDNGEDVSDRTGVGTRSIFGYQMRFDLRENFPAVTTKRLAWKAVVGELLWLLEGSTDERRLAEITYGKPREELTDKRTIWTGNADNQAVALGYTNTNMMKQLGPVYGHQWRSFDAMGDDTYNKKDQITWLINEIKTNPDSRRLILSAWNPNQLDRMALPPCHTLAQFRVMNGELSCQLYQRSADMFLGVPFNIASYSLLVHIIATICDLKVADFVWVGGDCHIYSNHMDQVRQQIEREPRGLPTLEFPNFKTLDEVLASRVADFVLNDYNPMESIKAPMAI